jgi:hypothetical protein
MCVDTVERTYLQVVSINTPSIHTVIREHHCMYTRCMYTIANITESLPTVDAYHRNSVAAYRRCLPASFVLSLWDL